MLRNSYTYSRGLSGKLVQPTEGMEVEFADPVIEVATVAEVKRAWNIVTDDYDEDIRGYIATAVRDIEAFTGRTIVKREVTAYFMNVEYDFFLPYPNHVSIESITSITDGVETVLTTDEYEVKGLNQYYIVLKKYFGTQIKVVYTAGYGTSLSSIPASLHTAVVDQVSVYLSKYNDSLQATVFDEASKLTFRAYSASKRYKVYG